MTKILLIEDNIMESNMYKEVLSLYGFECCQCFNGEQATKLIEKEKFDLLVVDVMMPVMDGYEFVSLVRRLYKEIPILMISANNMINNRLKGFELGIDDFLVKPFNNNEFIYRIKALLRRYNINLNHIIDFSDTYLDSQKMLFKYKDEIIHLTEKEFYLLFKLLVNQNKVLTKEQLIDDLWTDVDFDSNVVESQISRIKRKTKIDQDFRIVNIRNIGYMAEVIDEN